MTSDRTSPDATATAPTQRQHAGGHGIPAPVGVLLAIVAGMCFALQSRITGAVAAQLHDGFAAAALSFGFGAVLMVIGVAVIPAGRRALGRLRGGLREANPPVWYLVAGAIGASVVLAQGVTIGVLGVAIFTIALVAGQTISGILVDATGFGTHQRRRPTLPRSVGSVLTIVAVVWAVESRFTGGTDLGSILGPLLFPFIGGLFYGFQQAMNGRIGRVAGTPMISALTNFTVGALVLILAWGIKQLATPAPAALPGQWWAYLPGPLGITVISLSAMLAPRLGVLLLGLGIIAGQLVGSLGLDVIAPAAGTHVAFSTVGGTALTLVAVAVATLPWRSQRRFADAGRRARQDREQHGNDDAAAPGTRTDADRPAR
ncbi:DMT family transporter [Tersicoccus sp. MR15.9]|uniref:DMT family transporter n=1 Tax=Tersicoccus mangrovi TaxID=3121635 RepID=UPI002FE5911C